MLNQLRRVAILAAVAIAAFACGPFHRGGPPDAVVVFKNQSTDQADVYALGPGGAATRIGTVFAGRTDTLRVPSSITGGANRVNVVARIFATSKIVASGPFTLAPGDTMVVTLGQDEKLLGVLPAGS
jgi:hypothetical protein